MRQQTLIKTGTGSFVKLTSPRHEAFSRVDLCVAVGIVLVLGTLFLRAQIGLDARAQRMVCMDNLRQIGVAFRGWGNEHHNKLPMEVGPLEGGSADAVANGQPWLHFKVVSNYFGTTRTVICPSDVRLPATTFSNLAVTNVSYFVGLNVRGNVPEMLLSGDRNVTNGAAPQSSIIELTDASRTGWTDGMHNRSGNVLLADGSARHLSTAGLQRQLSAANDGNRQQINRLHLPISSSDR
jgi:prepilin-type processing-associated H-X9-DG protein